MLTNIVVLTSILVDITKKENFFLVKLMRHGKKLSGKSNFKLITRGAFKNCDWMRVYVQNRMLRSGHL